LHLAQSLHLAQVLVLVGPAVGLGIMKLEKWMLRVIEIRVMIPNSNVAMSGANTEFLEELRVVELEIKSFIFIEIPRAQLHALNLLQAAALQLRCAQAKEGATADIDRSVIAFLESSDRTVVSSLKLSECHVSELDVNIRFPKYNKGAGQHFSIVPRSSYLLRQVIASSSALHSMTQNIKG
jgi:hypothetical protein